MMFLSEVFFWGEAEARRGAKQGGDGAPATWGLATARGATFFFGNGWTWDELMLKGGYPLLYNYDGWIEYHLASAIIPRIADLGFSSSLNLPRVLFYYAFVLFFSFLKPHLNLRPRTVISSSGITTGRTPEEGWGREEEGRRRAATSIMGV